MKKIIILSLLLLFATTSVVCGQGLRRPAEGKSMVYITRTSSVAFLIGFQIFDSKKYLGTLNAGKYIVYECDPGKHIFIAKSENADFIDAELEAGRIYIIDAVPQMGIMVAQVDLVPLDKNSKRYEKSKKSIFKLIGKKSGIEVKTEDYAEDSDADEESSPSKTLAKFEKRKEQGKVSLLLPDMFIEIDEGQIELQPEDDPNEESL